MKTNFLKRFIVVAVALFLVIGFLPANVLTANAAEITYTFDSADLTAAVDKEVLEPGAYGTNGYFNLVGSITKRVSSGAVNRIELAKKGAGSITFTVSGTANVSLTCRSTGDGNISDIVLQDADGNAVASTDGVNTVTGSSFITVSYAALPSGTYTILAPANGTQTGRGVQIGTVEVVETVGHVHTYDSVVTAPSCTEKGYTTYTCNAEGCDYSYVGDYVDATGHSYGEDGYCVNGCGRCVHAVDYTYTFVPGDLTIETGDKEEIGDGAAIGTDGAFSVVGTVTMRGSAGAAAKQIELAKEEGGKIAFTVSGNGATLTLGLSSTGGSNNSLIAVVDEYGFEQIPDEEVTTTGGGQIMVTGTSTTTLTYSDLWAGTYYIVSPADSTEAPEGEEYEAISRNTRVLSLKLEETVAVGCEHNPISLFLDEQTETVTVPAGETVYYQGYINGMNLSINGEDKGLQTSANPRMPVVFNITNEGTEAAEYVLVVSYPAGTMSNPEVVEAGSHTASIEAGNMQGYFYTWTAPADGTATFAISSENTVGWTYTINNVTAGTYGDAQWNDSDPVITTQELTVAEGDELQIIINTYDPADMWSNPAGDIAWSLDFLSDLERMQAIVDAAYALADGASTEEPVTLTGKIVSIQEAYDAEYGNVTLTMAVEGYEDKPIYCYRIYAADSITDEDMANLLVGDTITVTGYIKNYYGTIEFCTVNSVGATIDEIVKTEEIPFTVTFDVPADVAAVAPISGNQNGITLPSAEAAEGYSFVGWVTAPVEETATMPETIYAAGSSFAAEADLTLYALYSYGETTYELYSGALVEGDYVIAYNDGNDDGALKAAMGSSNRLAYGVVTVSNGVASNVTSDLVWHIAPDGDYWTIYNEATGKYAAATSTNNKGALLSSVTDYAKWTASGSDVYDFVNLGNSRYLRRNGTYGFAAYSSQTGGALSLYKMTGDLNYSTEVGPELFNMAGVNLALNNDITLYLYLMAENYDSGYTMEIVKSYADGSSVTKTVAATDWESYYGTMYRVGFNGIAAKEMTDEITVTVYDASGNAVSKEFVTTVADAAVLVYKSEANAASFTMMADLLNYGAAAQGNFRYNTDDLANTRLTAEQAAYASARFDMSTVTGKASGTAGAMGATLYLDTNIQHNFIFDAAVVDSTMTAKVSYTNYKGVANSFTIPGSRFVNNGSMITVNVSALTPADVNVPVTVQIVDANGAEVCSLTDSIAWYCVRAQASATNNLFIELMEFATSCNAYFG